MKSEGKLFHCTRVEHLAWISSLFFAFTITIRCKNAARTAACVSPEMLACLLAYETGSRQFCGQFIQVKAMGNVAAGRREMPSKVFNSTTVYLKNDEEAGGRERNAILVLTLLYVGNTLTVVIT